MDSDSLFDISRRQIQNRPLAIGDSLEICQIIPPILWDQKEILWIKGCVYYTGEHYYLLGRKEILTFFIYSLTAEGTRLLSFDF